MRKSLLAVAALMGVAALPQRAEAVAFRVAEDISGNMGFRGQIWGQVLGERTSGNKGAVDFRLNNVRLYANGNVGKYMFFGANLDFEPGTARASDAFIGIRFQDEFRVQAGLFRTPFSRAALTDSYTFLVPTGYFYSGTPVPGGYYRAGVSFEVDAPLRGPSRYRNLGLAIWGELGGKDVPFKYYLGVFDGPYNNSVGAPGSDNLMFSARVQFTPTTLGFKGERGYGLRDTQLGRQNVLSFGLGYTTQKCQPVLTGLCSAGTSFTTSAFTIDAKHEQRFGKNLIAGWEAAYFDVKDVNTAKDDRRGFYVQVSAINDQRIGVGKAGIAIKYDYAEQNPATGAKSKLTRIGGAVNYFLKGQDALLQLAVDRVEPNFTARNNNPNNKKFTDLTLAFQVQF
ncbi:MAG: OprO/OprP family phosphate-selective porin [Aquificaceae bacterium]|nr:OprO/OprP family phosphate-selective porin [Aquificaceae bacterium]